MAEFNPIRDLMPMDSIVESDNKSAEQIETVKIKLSETKNAVSNVLGIIKVKNTILSRDLKKIKNLNYILNRTIPRIPTLRGVAGVQFGSLGKSDKKKRRLNSLIFPPTSPKTEDKVTYDRPFIKQTANVLSKALDIYFLLSAVKGLKGLFVKPPANIIKPVPPGTLTPKPPIKEPVKVPNFFEKIFKKPVKKFSPIEKTGSKLDFSKSNVGNIFDLPASTRMKMAVESKTFPGISKKGLQSRELSNLLKKEKQLQKKYENLLKNKNIKELQEFLRQQIPSNKYKVINGKKVLNKNAQRGSGFKERKKEFVVGSDDKNTTENMRLKSLMESFGFKPKNMSSLQASPNNTDLASLNIDTGVTNTVIILTDPPTA